MGTQHRWLWLLLFMFIKIIEITTKELRVVCYYTNWSVYRPGSAKFSPQNINPYLCTHLVYAFGGFTKENTLKPFDKYQDIEKGGYAKFTGLKTYNKNLKTMLAIGGWNEGSSRFSPMVASPERRKELVKNVVKFLRQNHFDGLDLDWEYPSFRDGGKSRDRDNYAQLVQELREEFERESQKTGRPRLLLTMAVPAGIEYINKGYDIPKLTKYLDWMNILSYDYHSAFEPSVNHHAPLYPLEEENEYNYDTDLNIDHTIQHYLKAGAISDKLVLGIPTYGRSYTLFNPDANDIGAPADGPGEMGDATRENGYLAYYEICDSVNSGEWNVVQPNDEAMGPYAYKENQWVGYDDEAIVRKKAQYVAEKDLGGIMFWSIDNDDFRGTCHNKSYPIIEAAKEALVESLGLGDENAIQKYSKNTKSRGSRLRNKVQRTKEEPSTERTRNSGGRQGADPSTSSNSSRRRSQARASSNESTSSSSKSLRRRRPGSRRTSTTESYEPARERSGSSLVVTTPSWKTPEPPTTPDPGGDFKCEDEGFYPHPRDCKRYFWCLNGPSELGIIAHQFTCPAGLYFNKAASSCDYTQNVLCNKKKATTTTTTTTSKSSSTTEEEEDEEEEEVSKKPESAFVFSTRRPAPKITAATSRTTFVSTTSTTTPEYEDYEYEDAGTGDVNDSDTDSEDPQVIKELLELIKKAGGIDELEKQLNIKDDSNVDQNEDGGSTTTSPIKQKLYQRVLAKTKLVDPSGRTNSLKYSGINRNRNSRGPQNEGLSGTIEDKSTKTSFRPKYSTINRARTTKVEDADENKDEEKDVEENDKTTFEKPKYVSLRRHRVSTIAERDSEDQDEDVRQDKKKDTTTTSKTTYVTLRRSRPTTTTTEPQEEPLDRKVLGEEGDNEESASPNYVILNRNRPSSTDATTSKYKEIRRSTTASNPVTDDVNEEKDLTTYDVSPTSTSSTTITNSKITNTLLTHSSNDEPLSHTLSFETPSTPSTTSSTETPKNEIIQPQLLEPRPFSISDYVRSTSATKITTSTTTTTISPTETTKVSSKSLRTRPQQVDDSNVQTQSRNRIRGNSRFTLSHAESPQLQQHEDTERHYRPEQSSISDLSSLTAVDFAYNVHKSNKENTVRRSRPRFSPSTTFVTHAPISTTTTSTSLAASTRIDDTLKTGSSRITVGRKYLENSQFVSSNRRRTTALTSTTSTDDYQGNVRIKSTTEDPKVSKLQRKIIRRLRPTTATIAEEGSSSVYRVRSTTPLPYRRRQNEIDASNTDDEDEENINLSESNILENSDLNRLNSNAIHDDVKSNRKVIKRIRFATPSTTTKEDDRRTEGDVVPSSSPKTSTEPNIIIRTRKIVRKLSTTPSTFATDEEERVSKRVEGTTDGRRFKIIRRLRPTTATTKFLPETETETTDVVKTRLRPVSSNKYNPNFTASTFSTVDVPTEESIRLPPHSSSLSSVTNFDGGKDSEDITTVPSPDEAILEGDTTSPTDEPISSSTVATSSYTNKIYKSAEDRPKLDLKGRLLTTSHHTESTTKTALRFEGRSKRPFILRPTENSVSESPNRLLKEEVEDLGHGIVKPFRKLYKGVTSRTLGNRFGALDDEDDVRNDNLHTVSSTVRSYNRNPYRFTKGTTEPTDIDNEEDDEDFDGSDNDPEFNEEEDRDDGEEDQNVRPLSGFRQASISPFSSNGNGNARVEISTKRANTPFNRNNTTKRGKPTTRNSYKRFTSTTPLTTTANLTDINVEALNQRNKQLFTKSRKMNTPFAGPASTVATNFDTTKSFESSTDEITSEADLTTDITTFSNEIANTDIPGTTFSLVNEFPRTENHAKTTTATDKPTTFYHIFAETESSLENQNAVDGRVPKNFEKLIEVNRIVQIDNGNNTNNGTLVDHIGVVNRVTKIEIVDGDSEGMAKQGALKININGVQIDTEYLENNREERKFEIYGESKVVNYTQQNPHILVNAKAVEIIPNQIRIESKSNVHTITPKPLFTNEVSTIALEGLFRTESPLSESEIENNDGETRDNKEVDELLETEHSKYVNVKILDQDRHRNEKAIINPKAKFVPLKILNQDLRDVKAQVVEVARDDKEVIKIAPIAVAVNKKEKSG